MFWMAVTLGAFLAGVFWTLGQTLVRWWLWNHGWRIAKFANTPRTRG